MYLYLLEPIGIFVIIIAISNLIDPIDRLFFRFFVFFSFLHMEEGGAMIPPHASKALENGTHSTLIFQPYS